LKAASGHALAMVAVALVGCSPKDRHDDPVRMKLKDTYAQLHQQLEKAAVSEPLVALAFADHGQVVLAIRSGLIEELAGNVARRYLDRVTLDLRGVEAHGSGELRKKTLLGRMKLGDWTVSVDLGDLKGDLRAGSPRVRLRGPDLIEVELPVEVQETEGDATLRFGWDSAALANVVCKDFELTREIHGRVLAQRHRLSGALRLANTGESLTVTPVFPDREVALKLDLTARSWGVVDAALRSQDSFGKCGTLMDPDKGLEGLKELAASGIKIRLPRSIFRTVSLPAHMQRSVKVNQRTVALGVKAESLCIDTATLWSSVSVQVQAGTKP
jgi:hypothetical protein